MASFKCRHCDLRTPEGNSLCPLCSKKYMVCSVCDQVTPAIRRGGSSSIACAECYAASKGNCTKCGKPIIDEFSTIRLGRRGRSAMAVCQRCRTEMMPLANLHGLPMPKEALFDSDDALISSVQALKLVTYELDIDSGRPWIPVSQLKFILKLKDALGPLKIPLSIVLYPILPPRGGKPSGKAYLGSFRGTTTAYNIMPEACRSYLVHAAGYEMVEDLPTRLTGFWPASLAQVLVSSKIVQPGEWENWSAPRNPNSFKDIANFVWIEANRVGELVRLAPRRSDNFYLNEADLAPVPEERRGE